MPLHTHAYKHTHTHTHVLAKVHFDFVALCSLRFLLHFLQLEHALKLPNIKLYVSPSLFLSVYLLLTLCLYVSPSLSISLQA